MSSNKMTKINLESEKIIFFFYSIGLKLSHIPSNVRLNPFPHNDTF